MLTDGVSTGLLDQLPRSLLPAEPPYQANSHGGLLLPQYVECVGQEVWLVGKIAAPFFHHDQVVCKLVLEREGLVEPPPEE